MKKNLNFLMFGFLFPLFVVSLTGMDVLYAQQRKIDSLLKVLKTSREDTSQVNTLSALSSLYTATGVYQKGLQYGIRAQQQAVKINFKKGLANAFNNIGSVYFNGGTYAKALENYFNALKIREKINDKRGIGGSYNNIGLVYAEQGNYEKSMESHLKSLKIREEIGDKKGIAGSYNNIGSVYKSQGNYEKALENYFKSFKLLDEISIEHPDDNVIKKAKGNFYNNIGLIYMNKGNYNDALNNYWKALKIREEVGDKHGIASSYNNIGNVYTDGKNYKEALDNHFKSLKIEEEIGDKNGLAGSYNNIGSIYLKSNQLVESYYYFNKAYILFKKIGNKDGIKDTYYSLFNLFKQKGDFSEALRYHKLYSYSKDTIINEHSNKKIAEMSANYESEKKDNELIKKEIKISKQKAERDKQNLQRNIFIIGFAFVLILAFFIYRSYYRKKNANKLLEEKNLIIENQKQRVEDNNLKITDSINYAERIQNAILPSRAIINSLFPDAFIFFKPKDIVSGDFYWMHAIDKNHVLIAAVDCSGHGVPGALMSMMGYNLLEQVVKEHLIDEPAMILNELSKLVVESLRQTNDFGSSRESMDIALCKINYQNYELEYAGARNSLYLIRNGKLSETKADNRSIGISYSNTGSFLNHKIQVKKGDSLYIFSDGYADQFGSDNEKFYYQPFRDLVTQICELPAEEQHMKLEKTISDWKGDKEQTDDILVIGIKI